LPMSVGMIRIRHAVATAFLLTRDGGGITMGGSRRNREGSPPVHEGRRLPGGPTTECASARRAKDLLRGELNPRTKWPSVPKATVATVNGGEESMGAGERTGGRSAPAGFVAGRVASSIVLVPTSAQPRHAALVRLATRHGGRPAPGRVRVPRALRDRNDGVVRAPRARRRSAVHRRARRRQHDREADDGRTGLVERDGRERPLTGVPGALRGASRRFD